MLNSVIIGIVITYLGHDYYRPYPLYLDYNSISSIRLMTLIHISAIIIVELTLIFLNYMKKRTSKEQLKIDNPKQE